MRSVYQALLEAAVPPHVSTPMEEGWVGWGLVFDHFHLVEELLCHHETISSMRVPLARGDVRVRHLREGETAFPVVVADGCPTWRSGFKLVAFVLLPCLMSSRLSPVCRVHEGEPGSPLQGMQEAVPV